MSDQRYYEEGTRSETSAPDRVSSETVASRMYDDVGRGVTGAAGSSKTDSSPFNFRESDFTVKTLSALGFPDVKIGDSSTAAGASRPGHSLVETFGPGSERAKIYSGEHPAMKALLSGSGERAGIRMGSSEVEVKSDRTSVSATDKTGKELFKIELGDQDSCKVSKVSPEGAKLLASLKIPTKAGETFTGAFSISDGKMTYTSNPGTKHAKEYSFDASGKRIETSHATGLRRHFDATGKLESTYMRTSRGFEPVQESNVREAVPVGRAGIFKTTVKMNDGRTITHSTGFMGDTERHKETDRSGKVTFDYDHKRDFPNALQKCAAGGLNGRPAENILRTLKKEEAVALATELDRLAGKTSSESAADAKREHSMSDEQKRKTSQQATEALRSLNGIAAAEPLPFVDPKQREALRAVLRRIHKV